MRFRHHKTLLAVGLGSVLVSGCLSTPPPPEVGQPSSACTIAPSPNEEQRLRSSQISLEVGPDELLAVRIDGQQRQSMFGELDARYILVDTNVDFTWEDAEHSTEPGAYHQYINIGEDFGTTYVYDVPPSTYTLYTGRVTVGAIGTCPKS